MVVWLHVSAYQNTKELHLIVGLNVLSAMNVLRIVPAINLNVLTRAEVPVE